MPKTKLERNEEERQRLIAEDTLYSLLLAHGVPEPHHVYFGSDKRNPTFHVTYESEIHDYDPSRPTIKAQVDPHLWMDVLLDQLNTEALPLWHGLGTFFHMGPPIYKAFNSVKYPNTKWTECDPLYYRIGMLENRNENSSLSALHCWVNLKWFHNDLPVMVDLSIRAPLKVMGIEVEWPIKFYRFGNQAVYGSGIPRKPGYRHSNDYLFRFLKG